MSAEIRARMSEIENELLGRDAYMDASILSPPDPQALLEHERHRERLRQELQALRSSLPPTGEPAGRLYWLGVFSAR